MSDRIEELRKKINKGGTSVYNLNKHNPAAVIKWISTGSRWLDSIIANRSSLGNSERAGIPVGRICEISGLESTGKSYMAYQIAANAQKMGIDVIYFDSEASTDSEFVKRMGVDLDSLLYFPAENIENVANNIENLLKENENPMLFILDSLANTPTIKEIESDYNPQSNIAIKARVLSTLFAKLIDPINKHGSTFLIVNQLKTNIDPTNPMIAFTEPYIAPGGKATAFAYSLRLWLTGRKAKKWFVENEDGEKIGSDVKVTIKKSRFGTLGRECNFKILWSGEQISIQDEESWLDALRFSDQFESGRSNKLKYEDGTEEKFFSTQFLEKLRTNEKFKNRVLEIMDQTLIKP